MADCKILQLVIQHDGMLLRMGVCHTSASACQAQAQYLLWKLSLKVRTWLACGGCYLSCCLCAAAAGLPVAFGTSHVALQERANLQAGQTVLVLGAAGGVGIAAVQVPC